MIKDQALNSLKRDTERKEKYGGDIVNLGDYVDTVGVVASLSMRRSAYYESQGGLKRSLVTLQATCTKIRGHASW